MKFICKDKEVISIDSDISIKKTLFCGQSFRWEEKENGTIIGNASDKTISFKQDNDEILTNATSREIKDFWIEYFDLNSDYSQIDILAKEDNFLKKCLEYSKGIRILRQDLWEMLISFIISQRNNIPNIKRTINKLCLHYGEEIETCKEYATKTFPTPERISEISVDELSNNIRCGYRAEYIVEATKFVLKGGLKDIQEMEYKDQLSKLKSIKGVGDKVANCVILFGLHNTNAFPIDVWIDRIIQNKYDGLLDTSVYGDKAGIIQQMMFNYAIKHQSEFKK